MHKKLGCLLIHGFGGSTEEVRPLSEKLTEEGYRVLCPSLKGHTGIRKDLKTVTYRDWIASAQSDLEKLKKECDSICIIGFSMGGLIAVQLARKYPAAAVVTLNSPIYYWDVKRVFLNIVDDFKRKSYDNISRYINSGRKLPLNALIQFRQLLSQTKPLLQEIRCPVFVAQALQDDTVRKKSADYIYSHVSSKEKSLQFYEGSGHLILWSKAAEKVMNDVLYFLYKL